MKKQKSLGRKEISVNDNKSLPNSSIAGTALSQLDSTNEQPKLEESPFKPNSRFKTYQNVFENLTKGQNVITMYPIVTVMLSYDSTRAITVTKKDDTETWIKMYSL